MSIKPIFDTSHIYSFDSFKDRINEFCNKLEAKKYTYMALSRKNDSLCNVDFTYSKKFGNIQAYKNISDDYERLVFQMKTKNITLYNYLFNSFSLATPLFAIVYFGTIITPIADWIQGQLRSDQIGQIRARYSSGTNDNDHTSLDIDELSKNLLRSVFGSFQGHLTINDLKIDL